MKVKRSDCPTNWRPLQARASTTASDRIRQTPPALSAHYSSSPRSPRQSPSPTPSLPSLLLDRRCSRSRAVASSTSPLPVPPWPESLLTARIHAASTQRRIHRAAARELRAELGREVAVRRRRHVARTTLCPREFVLIARSWSHTTASPSSEQALFALTAVPFGANASPYLAAAPPPAPPATAPEK